METISQLEQTIRGGLIARGANGWVDDSAEMHDAVQDKNIGLLTAFAKMAEHDGVRLRSARRLYEMLVHEGYTDAWELMSPETMIDFLRVHDVVSWVDPARPTWDESRVHYPLICLFIAAEGQNRDFVEEIVIERRIIDVAQVRELLAEMRSNAGALVGGVL